LGLIHVASGLTAPLRTSHFSASHRHGHEQNHKYHRDRHHDHDDAGANGEHAKGGAHASPSAKPFLQHTRPDRQAGAAEMVESLALEGPQPGC
jgi:hypothetical protein